MAHLMANNDVARDRRALRRPYVDVANVIARRGASDQGRAAVCRPSAQHAELLLGRDIFDRYRLVRIVIEFDWGQLAEGQIS